MDPGVEDRRKRAARNMRLAMILGAFVLAIYFSFMWMNA